VTSAILVIAVLLMLLAAGWYAARIMKGRIEAESENRYGVSRRVQVTGACVHGISQLAREPILVKREAANVSVQVGEEPIKALETVPDRTVRAAVREAVVAVDAQFGPAWTALVKAAGETSLHVTRLA